MNKLTAPASMTRTTIADMPNVSLPHAGIYVIAYLGHVLYVGKSELSVADRISGHMIKPSPLGAWLRRVDDWANVRLDVLEAPRGELAQAWLKQAEGALIHRFEPLFNYAMLTA